MQQVPHSSRCNGAAAMLVCLLCLSGCGLTTAAGAGSFDRQAGRAASMLFSGGGERSRGRRILQASALAASAAAGGNSSSSAIAEARKGTAAVLDAFTFWEPSFGRTKYSSRLSCVTSPTADLLHFRA